MSQNQKHRGCLPPELLSRKNNFSAMKPCVRVSTMNSANGNGLHFARRPMTRGAGKPIQAIPVRSIQQGARKVTNQINFIPRVNQSFCKCSLAEFPKIYGSLSS